MNRRRHTDHILFKFLSDTKQISEGERLLLRASFPQKGVPFRPPYTLVGADRRGMMHPRLTTHDAARPARAPDGGFEGGCSGSLSARASGVRGGRREGDASLTSPGVAASRDA